MMSSTAASNCQARVSSQPVTNSLPRLARTSNYAPSISSVISSSSTLVPEAHQQRGFKTREAYLAALEEFAEGHLYMPTGDHTLKGFYGNKTMEFYKAKSSPREDRKKRREQEVREKERRRTLPAVIEDSIPVTDGEHAIRNGEGVLTFSESNANTSGGEAIQHSRRKSKLGKIFGSRRGTIA